MKTPRGTTQPRLAKWRGVSNVPRPAGDWRWQSVDPCTNIRARGEPGFYRLGQPRSLSTEVQRYRRIIILLQQPATTMTLRSFYLSICSLCVILGYREQYRNAYFIQQQEIDHPSNILAGSSIAATFGRDLNTTECRCHLPLNQEFKAQSGQDQYLFQRVFFPQGSASAGGGLCCQGVFVEFGARNGIDHSNTHVFEKNLGWNGLLFEVDAAEHQKLVQNRPNSDVVLGPVCPSYMDNVTILLSTIPGFTGTTDTYEPSRYADNEVRDTKVFQCHHLAKELKSRNMFRIDYMTIDTEGSEPEIVKDFPWNEFDVRVIQIEQLLASAFPSQRGKKEMIVSHLESFGYRLLSEFPVGSGKTTQDLIFTRNVDSFLNMTGASVQPSRIWPHERITHTSTNS